jgi:hypothetical protein
MRLFSPTKQFKMKQTKSTFALLLCVVMCQTSAMAQGRWQIGVIAQTFNYTLNNDADFGRGQYAATKDLQIQATNTGLTVQNGFAYGIAGEYAISHGLSISLGAKLSKQKQQYAQKTSNSGYRIIDGATNLSYLSIPLGITYALSSEGSSWKFYVAAGVQLSLLQSYNDVFQLAYKAGSKPSDPTFNLNGTIADKQIVLNEPTSGVSNSTRVDDIYRKTLWGSYASLGVQKIIAQRWSVRLGLFFETDFTNPENLDAQAYSNGSSQGSPFWFNAQKWGLPDGTGASGRADRPKSQNNRLGLQLGVFYALR